MGYSTTVINGREVYCCDFCDNAPAKKHRCPSGYCHTYYICPDCWEKMKANGKWKETHKDCKAGHERLVAELQKEKDIMNAGYYVRKSALSHHERTKRESVKVIFVSGNNQRQAYFMSAETYHAIPYGVIATPEDYMQHGDIVPCRNTDIYDNELALTDEQKAAAELKQGVLL